MASHRNHIEVQDNFQGGITLATTGVKNGLLAAIELGLVDKDSATEMLFLIREAMQQLVQTMND